MEGIADSEHVLMMSLTAIQVSGTHFFAAGLCLLTVVLLRRNAIVRFIHNLPTGRNFAASVLGA
jgi:hypothetical protein